MMNVFAQAALWQRATGAVPQVIVLNRAVPISPAHDIGRPLHLPR
jgi:hypothetical protein